MNRDDAAATRRATLLGILAAATLPAGAGAADAEGLAAVAARKGIRFGAMVGADHLKDDAFRAAVVRECAILVPGIEMKWRAVENSKGRPNFRPADEIVAFAETHGMAMRAHTATWHQSVPKWAEADMSASNSFQPQMAYLEAVIGRYKGRILEWDVVNEAVEPKDGLPDGMRNSILLRTGGPGFVGDCFHAAAAIDPKAKLFYNDYGIEYDWIDNLARRRAILDLLTKLKRGGAPIHGFGVQAHLKVGNRFGEKSWRAYLAEIAALGLAISVTELDVEDSRLPADFATRDKAVADETRRFLDVTLDEKAVKTVLCWGLSDKYFWINDWRPRADKLPARGLPLDAEMASKLMRNAILESFIRITGR